LLISEGTSRPADTHQGEDEYGLLQRFATQPPRSSDVSEIVESVLSHSSDFESSSFFDCPSHHPVFLDQEKGLTGLSGPVQGQVMFPSCFQSAFLDCPHAKQCPTKAKSSCPQSPLISFSTRSIARKTGPCGAKWEKRGRTRSPRMAPSRICTRQNSIRASEDEGATSHHVTGSRATDLSSSKLSWMLFPPLTSTPVGSFMFLGEHHTKHAGKKHSFPTEGLKSI
jgi:hypothetical protein